MAGYKITMEPLKDHLKEYEQLMMQYYGAGVQACYRGPRLYDSTITKELVKRVIAWYNKYRFILNSDIIHQAFLLTALYQSIVSNPSLIRNSPIWFY